MPWRESHSVELETPLDRRIRDLELGLIIGRTHQGGERTERIKWEIVEACFNLRLPWEQSYE